MKRIILIGVIACFAFLSSCTDNQSAMHYGGEMKIHLPAGEVLENATWKANKASASLWYLTRKREPGETPKTHIFREKSDFGMMQGSVIFVEH
jgi:hypothetical protein